MALRGIQSPSKLLLPMQLLRTSNTMTTMSTCPKRLTTASTIHSDPIGVFSQISIQPRRFYNRKKTVKIPPTKTLKFDYAGDYGSLDHFDATQPKNGFENVKKFTEVDDTIKKIFSIEFSTNNEVKNKHIEQLVKEIQLHPADTDSIEVRIAYLTVMIRNQMNHVQAFRKDKCAKAQLVGRIQARKKYMRMLREIDYERFEEICEKLKIKYIPTPEYNRKESRKGRLKREHNEAAFAKIKETMEAYNKHLQEEKLSFLKYKEETLAQIIEDLNEISDDADKELVELYAAVASGNVDTLAQ